MADADSAALARDARLAAIESRGSLRDDSASERLAIDRSFSPGIGPVADEEVEIVPFLRPALALHS